MKNTLMIYYSFEGNTKFAAELTAKACPEIVTEQLRVEKEPPKTGLGKFLRGGKSALMNEDPGLLPLHTNPDNFDRIIIAFPVWAGTYPPAIGAFLRKIEIKGKEIFIIACSASGNADKAIANLKEKLSGNTVTGSLSLTNPLKHKEETEKLISDFLKERGLI